jgi:hypothetical protein
MIQTFVYRAPLDGLDFETVSASIQRQVDGMIRVRRSLLGCKTWETLGVIHVEIRLEGLDRWRIAGEARKIGSYLLASHKLPFTRPLLPHTVETAANRRYLTADQGRVPKSRKGHGSRSTSPSAPPA